MPCLPLIFAIIASPAAASEAATFTLYRNSLLDAAARVHVATFDTDEGEDYNRENCNLVAGLLQAQDGIATRFWCEAGRYSS